MATFATTDGGAYPGAMGRVNRRILAGVALSLALHALVLSLQRREAARAPAQEARPLAVRLRPPPPPAPAPAPQVQQAPAPASTPAPQPPRRALAGKRPVIAVEPAPAPAQTEPFTVQQAPQATEEAQAPHFDREAARTMARSLSHIRDPAKVGTAIGNFPTSRWKRKPAPHARSGRRNGAIARMVYLAVCWRRYCCWRTRRTVAASGEYVGWTRRVHA